MERSENYVQTVSSVFPRFAEAEGVVGVLHSILHLLTRKLQVGKFIRTGRIDSEQTDATAKLRDRLEDMRMEVLDDNFPKALEMWYGDVQEAFRRCHASFRKE